MEKKSDLSSVRDSQGFENPTEHLHCSENKQNDWFLKKEKKSIRIRGKNGCCY